MPTLDAPAIMQRLKLLLILLSVVILVGCGFQLRGQMTLSPSMQVMEISLDDPTTDFAKELVAQLVASGVQVSQRSTQNASVLSIHSQRLYRQALTISADARVQEYILYLEVRYSLQDAMGTLRIDNQVLRASREYQFDAQAILGGQREEELLTGDLSRAMATQLVRRLAALGPSSGVEG